MSIQRAETIQAIMNDLSLLKRSTAAHYGRLLHETGLTRSQAEVLVMVAKQEAVTSRQLAQQMQLTPGAVAQLVDVMERKGLICRAVDPQDRRVLHLSLSEGGKQKMASLKRLHRSQAERMMTLLTDEELETFQRILTKSLSLTETNTNPRKDSPLDHTR
jgi:DNA-binding MarR family transcriptional regulator